WSTMSSRRLVSAWMSPRSIGVMNEEWSSSTVSWATESASCSIVRIAVACASAWPRSPSICWSRSAASTASAEWREKRSKNCGFFGSRRRSKGTLLEDRDRIDGRGRAARDHERRDHELERPAALLAARARERLEVEIVEQVQAHRDDRDRVDRQSHAVDARGDHVGDAVRAERRD